MLDTPVRMKTPLAISLSLATAVASAASGPANLHGEWRGQAQYQATIAGAPDPNAHAVTNLTIRVEPDGKVSENGCKLLGIWRPMGATMNVATLDVTLSGCKYGGLNRRYSGSLAYYSEGNVQLSLNTFTVAPGKAAAFDIKATMRR